MNGPNEDRCPGVGDTIEGEYELLQELTHGNTEKDRVFLARYLVVLKFPTKGSVARFDREYAIRTQIEHPNVSKVIRRSKHEGLDYMVQSFAGWVDLYGVQRDNLLRREDARQVFQQVCAALQHIHGKGIVHRDVKPANVCLRAGEEGEVVVQLVDFNASRQDTSPAITNDEDKLPRTEMYCSPEQFHGNRSILVDTRADLWALSVVLYEMLHSSRALLYCFTNRDHEGALRELRKQSRNVRGFGAFFDRAFHGRIEERFQTVRELRDAAEQCFAKDMRATTDGERRPLWELVRGHEQEAAEKIRVRMVPGAGREAVGRVGSQVEIGGAGGRRRGRGVMVAVGFVVGAVVSFVGSLAAKAMLEEAEHPPIPSATGVVSSAPSVSAPSVSAPSVPSAPASTEPAGSAMTPAGGEKTAITPPGASVRAASTIKKTAPIPVVTKAPTAPKAPPSDICDRLLENDATEAECSRCSFNRGLSGRCERK